MLLHRLIDAMNATKTTDMQYLIQTTAPIVVKELDRVQALRKTL